MAPNPFLNELTALQQIDFDIIGWSSSIVANLQANAALSTSGAMRTRVDFIDMALSTIYAAILNPTNAGQKHISALVITNPVMGAVSGSIIAANPARTYLLITNPTAVDVFIHFGGAAVVTDLKIGAGGYWSSGDTGVVIYDGAIAGITGGGAAALTVVEG